jgi:ABC-2 type transport system permease protein
MNWVKDILSRQIFNYGTEKIWIGALTTGGLLLTLLWFAHWEGRKNYE